MFFLQPWLYRPGRFATRVSLIARSLGKDGEGYDDFFRPTTAPILFNPRYWETLFDFVDGIDISAGG